MAFYEWDENNQNSYTGAQFEDVNSRKNGFQPGTPISSIETNTALKQANLVACALMDTLGITSDDVGTDRATLATDILTGLNQGRANITGNYIPNTDNDYYLGQDGKRWKGIYATNGIFNSLSATHGITAANGDIILSSSGNLTLAIGDIMLNSGNISLTGASTKVKAPIIEDSTGTLQSLRSTVENQGMLIDSITTNIENKTSSKSNVVNSNFTTNLITYCRSGNVVCVSFNGTNTQQANDFIIDNIDSDRTQFRPLGFVSSINIPLGTAVVQRGSDGADIGNVPLYIYYDSTNNNLKLKYIPKDGTSNLLLTGMKIFGTATYIAQ